MQNNIPTPGLQRFVFILSNGLQVSVWAHTQAEAAAILREQMNS